MNIFEKYLSKINKIILDNKKDLKLIDIENIDNINLEVPPDHFNYDLSSNVSLVLAKPNKLNPINLAKKLLGWTPKIKLVEGLKKTIPSFENELNRLSNQ